MRSLRSGRPSSRRFVVLNTGHSQDAHRPTRPDLNAILTPGPAILTPGPAILTPRTARSTGTSRPSRRSALAGQSKARSGVVSANMHVGSLRSVRRGPTEDFPGDGRHLAHPKGEEAKQV